MVDRELTLIMSAITKSYSAIIPVHALRSTNLTITPGEYVAITGSSGSGKSTLLNMLGVLDVPTSGSYTINNVDVVNLPEKDRAAIRSQLFGFVFQSFHLQPSKTAAENVELAMLYGGVPIEDRRNRSLLALDSVGLGERYFALPRELSGGERQRVAIARAVVHRPSVLFCDEPTGNLDNDNTEKVMGLIQNLSNEGMTVIVVTHETLVADRARSMITVNDGVVREVKR